jgi:hypothetical protein
MRGDNEGSDSSLEELLSLFVTRSMSWQIGAVKSTQLLFRRFNAGGDKFSRKAVC